jgi:hypothetical protein
MTREEAESDCVDSLMAGDVERACVIASQFNHENGGQFDATAPVRLLTLIFAAAPRILSGVTAGELQVLRVGAAMMELWGTNRCTQCLPSGFRINLAMNVDAAARMVLFSAQSRRSTTFYRDSAVVDAVEWLATPESCPACMAMAGRRFTTDAPPELPYEHCTHRMGVSVCANPDRKLFKL